MYSDGIKILVDVICRSKRSYSYSGTRSIERTLRQQGWIEGVPNYKKKLTERASPPQGGGGHNFCLIKGGVRATLAFVGRGTLRNISLCEARFLAPQPPPDDYGTVPYSVKCYHRITTQLITNNNLSTYLELLIACPSQLITDFHNCG